MTITSRDVARLAGVSQPTVSRALRGDPKISDATRTRVRTAAAELGYVSSELGRNLSTRSTRQIAMVSDLENPLYPALVGPLHDTFAERGYRMVLLIERGDEMGDYEGLFNGSVDGAVLTTPLLRSSLAVRLQERGLPFVQLNRASELVDGDFVIADNVSGGADVAELLLGLGHRRIGAVLGPEQASSARGREEGFRQRLEREPGIDLRLVRPGSFSFGAGCRGLTELLQPGDGPTAVFCANDIVAIGAMNAAVALRRRVPEDVSIVGFDDIEMAGWPCFALTTVDVNMSRLASRAAEILTDRLEGRLSAAVQEVHRPTLVLRGSHRAVG